MMFPPPQPIKRASPFNDESNRSALLPIATARSPRKGRSGVVLLEVLLACFLLGMSLVLLSTLGKAGRRMAVLAQLQSHAAIRCETVLNELIVGAKVLSYQSNPFEDDAEWIWIASVQEHDSELKELTVQVYRKGEYADQSEVTFVRLLPSDWAGATDSSGRGRSQ